MNLPEDLITAQQQARDMLVERYDAKHHIPMRAPSHVDLWPGDRWPEAYVAAGETAIAEEVFAKALSAIRPDGSMPHLLQNNRRHAIGPLEPKSIDRWVYEHIDKTGVLELANGQWVTEIYAPPTWALSALALQGAGVELPASVMTALIRAEMALVEARGDGRGLIESRHKDELTNRDGPLAEELERGGAVIDPAVNALFIQNDEALTMLTAHGETDSYTIRMATDALGNQLGEAYDAGPFYPEQTLAVARMGYEELLRDEDLRSLYAQPDPTDSKRAAHYLSMAECLEVARLTAHREPSHAYLERIVPRIARLGARAMTRFEGVKPSKLDIIGNRTYGKQSWLPVAAQVVQISPGMLA